MLDQERFEPSEDSVNEFRHFIEGFKNRLTSENLRLSERYIKSELNDSSITEIVSCRTL